VRKGYVQVFEIDLDINNTAIDWSTDPDSYNTPKTTEDPNAFAGQFKTYRWSNQLIQRDLFSFPSLTDVSSTPPKINPGKDIGVRATASVTIADVVTNDTFELPESMNNRRVTGSANQKLQARNYLINRPARIITGTDPMNLSNAIVENYIIESFSINGRNEMTFNLVDPLYFTTESKAKMPVQSTAVINSDIDNAVTTINFTDPNEEYPENSTGFIRIGGEILSYEVTGFQVMAVVRGQAGTTSESHSAGDVMQFVVHYDQENVIDILADIITNYTNIDNSFIPNTKWNLLKANELSSFNLTNFISKPIEVKKVINQLIKITGVSFFFDTQLQEITITPTPRFSDPVALFTDEVNIKQNQITVKPDFKQQITRQLINWGKTDYSQIDDERYYSNGFQRIDGVAESSRVYSQEFAGEDISTDWLRTNSAVDTQIAIRIPQLNVERFSRTPQVIKFVTNDQYIGDTPNGRVWLSSVINVQTSKRLLPNLDRELLTAQITGLRPLELNDWEITALSYNAQVLNNVDLYINESQFNVNISTLLNPTEAREYIVVISSGVDIGSTSQAVRSLDTGVFPAGASLRIINLGRVLGIGGVGANSDDSLSNLDGGPGGTAINLQVNTVIDNLSGFIAAGGGGGAALRTPSGASGPNDVGGAGGGGQGYNPGAGGDNNILPGEGVGEDGTITAPGAGGVGGLGSGASGGAWATVGGITPNGIGGPPGAAIVTNGNVLTIESGNNSEQIRGAIV
jgi:hypothetical protein